MFILVMKYSKLLYEPLYKSLIKVNKKNWKVKNKNAKFIKYQGTCNGNSPHNLLKITIIISKMLT